MDIITFASVPILLRVH